MSPVVNNMQSVKKLKNDLICQVQPGVYFASYTN